MQLKMTTQKSRRAQICPSRWSTVLCLEQSLSANPASSRVNFDTVSHARGILYIDVSSWASRAANPSNSHDLPRNIPQEQNRERKMICETLVIVREHGSVVQRQSLKSVKGKVQTRSTVLDSSNHLFFLLPHTSCFVGLDYLKVLFRKFHPGKLYSCYYMATGQISSNSPVIPVIVCA